MAAILFDLDGVVYQGEQVLPGATQTIAWCRENHIPHLFITNTTSRPRQALQNKLQGMGIPVSADQILAPAVAARQWLQQNTQGKIALFIPEATRLEFQSLTVVANDSKTDVDAVVVGDLGEAWDFSTLNQAFRLLMREPHPALVALGMTRYWRGDDGLRLDAGAFVSALAYASGVTPVVLGKPAPLFYEAALQLLGSTATNTIMIGDDIRTDVDAAQKLGIKGVLVRTGKFRPADLELDISPYTVIDSVADLPGWLKSNT
ncbi:TIGR01458 family HAD-type hydrolase [Kaarinaea lacus]